ncbi:MAG: ABC transporter permease [Vicinamibacterales bacterium]
MLNDWWCRCRSLFRRDAVERELDEEIRSHFENLVEAHIRRGLTRDEAVRASRIEFGGFDQVKEAHRDVRGTAFIEAIVCDVRYAIRQGRKSPGVTALAILCLGLGIGVNTAIFGVLNAVLLRPMPVTEPDRLLRVERGQGGAFSYRAYQAYRDRAQTLSGIAASVPMESDLDVDGDSDIAVAEVVSANYGDIIGMRLLAGRWFSDDHELGAVISDSVWERKFQRRLDAIGRTIRSESQTYTIVGVTAPDFGGVFAPMRTDLWVPTQTRPRLAARLAEDRPFNMLMMFGRLSPGATAGQANAELNAIDAQLRTERFASDPAPSPIVTTVVRGQPNSPGRATAASLMTLLGAVVGLVLLIACANVGHLLLARGALRRRELVMRRALGASRARLVQQLLTEAVMLAGAGAITGILLATWANRLLQATFPPSVAVFALHVDLSLDWRALVFTSAVTVVAAALCGVLPAWRASDVAVSFPRDVRGGRLRRLPWGLVGQVVMSLVLLFVAGSFLQGLAQLRSSDPGFAVTGRLYAHTALPPASSDLDRRRHFYADALERLRAIPGIEAAALTSILPLIPAGSDCLSSPGGAKVATTASEIGAGYLRTLGIRLVAGEEFEIDGPQGAATPIIVNESLARTVWPGRSPVGQPVLIGCDSSESAVVSGVAGDSAIRQMGELPKPHLYRPLMRRPGGTFTTIVLVTSGDPAALTQPVRRALLGMGQGIRVYDVQPLAVPVGESRAAESWLTSVLAVFGLLALVLAAVGLCGTIAYRVSLRTQEIGVRMALGASRAAVFREVMGQGLMIVLAGVGIGEVLTAALTGMAASTLEGIARPGFLLHVAVGTIWIVVALVACYLPSARAARVDPLIALRHD